MSDRTQNSWWRKDTYQDKRPFLMGRRQIRRALSEWFERQDFIEVECGALQVSPGNETHLHAFATQFVSDTDGSKTPLYLHTSPEFACKKLLAAGETQIVDFARVYRNREASALHAPEFTMVEWYRAGAQLTDVMQDCVMLAHKAADTVEAGKLVWKEIECDPFAPPEMLSCVDAFRTYADIDLEVVLDDRNAFKAAAEKSGIGIQEDACWSDIFSAVLTARIEHQLGRDSLTFLHDYPVCEAALARAKPDDPRFAERFEMYACGVELANGFNELTDANEQRTRFEADMALKKDLYGESYPIDDDFIAALGQMPPACGVALGFDRLVMLATRARTINDVIWTPMDI